MSAKVSARQGASPGDGSRLWIGPVAALLVFSVVAWLLHRELEQIRVHDIIEHLQAIAGETLLMGQGFGIVTDIQTGPDGGLYVVSNTDGVVYRISAL